MVNLPMNALGSESPSTCDCDS